MIQVTRTLSINPAALHETFVRASGPGGQNVNKVETAVQLRLDLNRAGLPQPVRTRLERLAGRRITLGGDLLVTSQQHRTQDRNRAAALEEMLRLIRKAAVAPVRRVATKPTVASNRRRLAAKAHRAAIKRDRGITTE